MNLIGYSPDSDPSIEGVITDCTAFIPNERGMTSAPSAQSVSIAALPTSSMGASTVRKLDGTFRVFVGTATKLYHLVSSVWTDISRAVGGAYTLGVDQRWRFAQFGDTSLAISKTDILQSSASGLFADVALAPKAELLEVVGNFVFIANTNEVSFGDSPNRWWCAAVSTFNNWIPSIATQCATGILTSSAGRIYAMKKFGEQIIFYKERAIYIGTYVGAPLIWNMQQVVGDIGCQSQDAVVNIGSDTSPIHLFMGTDDFWVFDGARPQPIGGVVRKTVYNNLNTAFSFKIRNVHDQRNKRVYFYYPSKNGNGAVDLCVVYNYQTKQWGRDDRTIESALEYVSSGVTFDTWNTLGATFDTLPANVSFDSPLLSSGSPTPAFFDATHTIMTLDGVSTTSSFTTGDFGNDNDFMLLQRVKPVWLTKPAAANMVNFYKNAEGDTLVQDQTSNMSNSRFDVLRSARWHRFQFNLTGNSNLNQINAIYDGSGNE